MILNPVERYVEKKGIEKGIEKGKIEAARNMIEEGFSIGQIVRITGLSEEIILNLK